MRFEIVRAEGIISAHLVVAEKFGTRVERAGHADRIASRMSGKKQERAGIGVGVRDAGKRVLGPGSLLHGHDADLASQRGPREAVRHILGHALLTGHDGPNARFGERVQDRRIRKAKDLLDTLAFQDFGDRLAA